jgi:hypothetical protein
MTVALAIFRSFVHEGIAMPGAYAHMTLVNQLRETHRLDAIEGFSDEAGISLMRFFKFCELGAVSPDYPYLALGDRKAAQWADLMHYERTGPMIQAGTRLVAAMPAGVDRRKALSWLLGYAAHVTTDVTIHPVVELKVGKYQEHQREHRVCELHQDAYIFQRMNLGPIGLAEYLNAGIWACDAPLGSGRLDPVISKLWKAMLKECHPRQYRAGAPDPESWHRCFHAVIDRIEEGGRLFPAARHLAVDCGLTYPDPAEVDPQFIRQLQVPGNAGHLDYDAIFDTAIEHVGAVWGSISRTIFGSESGSLAMLGSWNLDTGRNEAGNYVFWS